MAFDWAEVASAPEVPRLAEPMVVTVPGALCERLTVAAELHSSTALKAALLDLQVLGPEARALAEHLRHHVRSFDMDAVQRLLGRCVIAEHPEAETASFHEVSEAIG